MRFLVLFALFTAAGTWVLMIGRRDQPARVTVEPATTAVQQTLEPATDDAIQPPIAAPTAAGPLKATTPRTGQRIEGNSQSAIRNSKSEILAAAPTPLSERNVSGRLPQVRTTDPQKSVVDDDSAGEDAVTSPPAVARLTPYILEAPSRQAQHDENQSSLH